ncbi:hypothetical protein HYX12_01085 [Candidatus Woesearchaeota archaeon]|nr:hypothetical protein [Candidatus Woesearchaeota archaeon]
MLMFGIDVPLIEILFVMLIILFVLLLEAIVILVILSKHLHTIKKTMPHEAHEIEKQKKK